MTFWKRVKKTRTCWLWKGATNFFGYGVLKIEGRHEKAHRVAWRLTNGRIPKNRWVLHRCDVGGCVRPSHLFLGTPKDNQADMIRKGRKRQVRGSEVVNAKLNEGLVREILKATGPIRAVGPMFGVSPITISRIRRGISWKHCVSV